MLLLRIGAIACGVLLGTPMPPAVAQHAGAPAAAPMAAPAAGDPGHGPRPAPDLSRLSPEQRAASRFPQPVRVGDLIGRQLLDPTPKQAVLGRVAGVQRGTDQAVRVLVDLGGLLGLGTRRVALPVEAVALMGQFVVVMDLDAAALRALPEVSGGGTAMGAEERIRVGLTKS